MKNIKLYELEETYHNEESSLEYPTVSYTKDTEKVWYMKPYLLPIVDFSNYETEFVEGEVYEKEYKLLKQIGNNWVPSYEGHDLVIDFSTNELYIEETDIVYDISNEPMYINYLLKIKNANRIRLYLSVSNSIIYISSCNGLNGSYVYGDYCV